MLSFQTELDSHPSHTHLKSLILVTSLLPRKLLVKFSQFVHSPDNTANKKGFNSQQKNSWASQVVPTLLIFSMSNVENSCSLMKSLATHHNCMLSPLAILLESLSETYNFSEIRNIFCHTASAERDNAVESVFPIYNNFMQRR